MQSVLNVAAYKFTPLSELKDRRERLKALCVRLQLKGTIMLSLEGINLFLAGDEQPVNQVLQTLEEDPEIGELEVKRSFSSAQPFSRMLVKLKREIIAFGIDGVDPQGAPTQKISPEELKLWLDEGKPCTLLDVRNNYEVRLGTFEQAVPIGIDHFRNFPKVASQRLDQHKDNPVVMFCTGGIRCEKAGPFLQQQGFREVYQLDGGILKYFERCGDEHFEGECFVFDKRTALDGQLRETDTTLCYACQNPLTAQEQLSSHYVPGVSCSYCFQTASEAS